MGFIGGNLSLDCYSPNLQRKVLHTQTASVNIDTIEFKDVAEHRISGVSIINSDIDITDNEITLKITEENSGYFNEVEPGGFNGHALSDQDDTISPILGFYIDPSNNSLNLQKSAVTFGQNYIAVNVSGLRYEKDLGYTLHAIFSSNGTVDGSRFNDVIRANFTSEVINGLAGNDQISGQFGNDKIDGGQGNDTLRGDDGNDTLIGGTGNDLLLGGVGIDKLTGNSGFDTFLFDTAVNSRNVDRITDFSAAYDTIRLENKIFKTLPAGYLKSTAFKDITDGAKLDADDRVLYNHDTGRVYYDRDGSGSASKVLFAIIDNDPVLTHKDFLIV